MNVRGCLALLWLMTGATGAAFAQQATHGSQSPAVGNMGNGVINYAFNNTNYRVTHQASTRLNSLDAKREALLMAENPTVLEVADVQWNSWFGDEVPFLDVVLLNRSKLPALNVQVDILDMASAGTLAKLTPYALAKSYTMKILADSPITVAGSGGWRWPIASVRDIQKITGRDCITGAGLDYDSPASGLDAMPMGGSSSYSQKGMYLRVRYKTIFGETVSYEKSVVIDSAPRSTSLYRERSSGKYVRLRCVGDPAEPG